MKHPVTQQTTFILQKVKIFPIMPFATLCIYLHLSFGDKLHLTKLENVEPTGDTGMLNKEQETPGKQQQLETKQGNAVYLLSC